MVFLKWAGTFKFSFQDPLLSLRIKETFLCWTSLFPIFQIRIVQKSRNKSSSALKSERHYSYNPLHDTWEQDGAQLKYTYWAREDGWREEESCGRHASHKDTVSEFERFTHRALQMENSISWNMCLCFYQRF